MAGVTRVLPRDFMGALEHLELARRIPGLELEVSGEDAVELSWRDGPSIYHVSHLLSDVMGSSPSYASLDHPGASVTTGCWSWTRGGFLAVRRTLSPRAMGLVGLEVLLAGTCTCAPEEESVAELVLDAVQAADDPDRLASHFRASNLASLITSEELETVSALLMPHVHLQSARALQEQVHSMGHLPGLLAVARAL